MKIHEYQAKAMLARHGVPVPRAEVAFSAAEAGQQIERAATSVVATAKEYPMTTLAVAAGLAFAVGALWKAGRSQPSRWDALQARMPDIPTARQLKSYWR